MINAKLVRDFVGLDSGGFKGGPELLIPELVGLLGPMDKVVMPFKASYALRIALLCTWPKKIIYLALRDFLSDNCSGILPKAEGKTALYFGTPTIVNNKPLFPDDLVEPKYWNRKTEHDAVKQLCIEAAVQGYKLIVSGLGSGDISPSKRMSNMGLGEVHRVSVVTHKVFADDEGKRFDDWIIVKDLTR